MVERIRDILKVYKLTPTQFADAIGIARPIVSHILSGRNKPSLEVVQKTIAAFPDLSLPWLLSGHGRMQSEVVEGFTPVSEPVGVKTPLQEPEKGLPARRSRSVTPEAVPQVSVPQDAPQASNQTPPVASQREEPPVAGPAPEAAPAEVHRTDSVVTAKAPVTPPGASTKAIRRIVVFYTDGTFADYQPE